MIKLFFIIILTVTTKAFAEETENYVIDPVHSSVTFKIRHFFSKVTGNFNEFEGTIIVNQSNMENNEIQATIQTNSIDTHNVKRDAHLQGPDFFDVEKYPKMTFQSKSWKKVDANEFKVTGDLSLHGITQEITLNVTSLGFGEGNGVHISGWEASTVIKKSDFGITYGGASLGNDVEVEIQAEARKT